MSANFSIRQIRRKIRNSISSDSYRMFERVRSSIRSLYYAGNNVECPFCKKKFRSFTPAGVPSELFEKVTIVGGGRRANSKCPFCRSVERERLIFLNLNMVLGTAPINILHFAPEQNLEKHLRKIENVRYTSADLYSKNVDLKIDVTKIDLPSEEYDVVICNHVLEHVDDDRCAMEEIKRVLKIGGKAIIQVPIAPDQNQTIEGFEANTDQEREKIYGQFDHVRFYGKDFYNRLESVDFVVNKVYPDSEQVARYALDSREALCLCSKS